MLNRAVVQPNPAGFLGMVADTMQAAEVASTLDDLFFRLEDAGIKEWSDRVALNPARIPPEHRGSAELDDARDRLRTHTGPGRPGLLS
jgi:hypothetical protein